ncbi:hypothetical protein [Weissella hellenica]|uniref:Uncharacterized protein n=2 Tax=Weissella hellenica TaxID=46256 RepID=A0A4Y4G3Q0_WEIHE|nr:hypothetical protein [Weissella hellenica]NKY67090.1 hypothetical protein [Weissella hellenica]GED36106.1 hypothetical protein WHE01_10100 [Weissella hellenica]
MMLFNKKLRDKKNELVNNDMSSLDDLDNNQNQGATLLTREEHRLTRHGRYELDPQTRKLTKTGKTTRLKHRLNMAIAILIGLILLTYVILFFL